MYEVELKCNYFFDSMDGGIANYVTLHLAL